MLIISIVRLYIFLANLTLKFASLILYSSYANPSSILIFRTGSIGDTVCAIPSIVSIRMKYPKARLTILTNSGGSKLVGMKSILDPRVYDELIDYYGLTGKQLISELRKRKFDLFIQLPQTDASFWRLLRDLIFFRSIAPSGWGWEYSTFPYFRQFQERWNSFPNETERLLAILKKHGIEGSASDYRLNVHNTEDLKIVDSAFIEAGLQNIEFILAIVVGAKRKQNRWPLSYFQNVIEHFKDPIKIILIGGPEDRELTKIFEGIPNVTDFTGKFTPMQSAIALSRCSLTLSNDTGPMHLSYATGTPTIGLFSSRDFPGKWTPPTNGLNSWYRTKNIHCSLCLSETCNNNICMQAIHPEVIKTEIEKHLNKNKH